MPDLSDGSTYVVGRIHANDRQECGSIRRQGAPLGEGTGVTVDGDLLACSAIQRVYAADVRSLFMWSGIIYA